MPAKPVIRAFFDEPTNTVSYLVNDPSSKRAAIIDPVLDYDHRTGRGSTKSADAILAAAVADGLTIEWVLETHAHADHLSGAPYIKLRTGAKVAIGEHIRAVQKIFRPIFNATDLKGDGSEFDRLLVDGEHIAIGALEVEVIHVPGHTPADVAYKIDDAVFVGDTLFMPDYGTARADFPGGSARDLYRSMRKLLELPPELASTYATTTRRQAESTLPGRPLSRSNARAMCTFAMVSMKTPSSPCARRATPSSQLPCC